MATLFYPGSTVVASVEIKKDDGTLYNPTTSTKITITAPDEKTKVVDGAIMTNNSTGKFSYDHLLPTNAAKGVYVAEYVATDGSRVSIQRTTFVVA